MLVPNKRGHKGIIVRSFRYNDDYYQIVLYTNDGDYTEVFKNLDSTGLEFSSGSKVTLNDKRIGTLRYPHRDDEGDNLVYCDELNTDKLGKEIRHFTDVNKDHCECFFIAEEYVAKILIETGLIK